MIRKHKQATPSPTGPVPIPDDVQQARDISASSDRQRKETVKASQRQQTWFERTIAPGLEELRIRREQNGFGQEFELSFAPRNRG